MSKKDEIAAKWETDRAIEAKRQEAMALLREKRRLDVENSFSEHAQEAVSTLVEVMRHEDAPPIARIAAAKDLLDRAGFKPVERQQVEVTMPKPIMDITAMQAE